MNDAPSAGDGVNKVGHLVGLQESRAVGAVLTPSAHCCVRTRSASTWTGTTPFNRAGCDHIASARALLGARSRRQRLAPRPARRSRGSPPEPSARGRPPAGLRPRRIQTLLHHCHPVPNQSMLLLVVVTNLIYYVKTVSIDTTARHPQPKSVRNQTSARQAAGCTTRSAWPQRRETEGECQWGCDFRDGFVCFPASE